jgi:hypothetical protein
MAEVVVKHFKRSAINSETKELVTEIVVESSDTARFLRRMEESRLTRPCFQTIDMRGRVAGDCRRYAFNDRVHYLDDVSFQMFEQGLKDNNGVYTVGTFEAIMGGAHTLHARAEARALAESRRQQIERRRLERARAAALERLAGSQETGPESLPPVAPVKNPEQLRLGYFRNRRNPRLMYACSVTLERGNLRVEGVTRDVSVCGLRVHIKGLTGLSEGQDVLVGFPGLAPDDGKIPSERVSYRVVRMEPDEAETTLYLSRRDMDRPEGFTELIEALIERHQRKYKLDIDDEYQSVLSWLYERSFAQSTTQIPFFVEYTDTGEPRVQAVAMSGGNAHLTRFFCTDEDNYNFTPLCLAHRLLHLDTGGSYLLAMYRQRGEGDQCMRIHSVADIEAGSQEAFQRLAAYVMQQSEYCIVKVSAGPVPALAVPEAKIDEVAQRLQYKSEAQMAELRARLRRLRLVGCMTDLTQDLRRYLGGAGPSTCPDGAVWVGGERRRLGDDTVTERQSLPVESLQPELVRFGYVERRREDRYLAETRVEVRAGERTVGGTSRDISTRGMRIHLDEKLQLRKGMTVKVGLVSLQQKKAATNLMDIPYQVVDSRELERGTELRLERVLGGRREGLKEFFVELITKNQHKLGVDIGDIWGAASSRVYESLLASNTPGLPFFIGRSDEGGAHLQCVGVPPSESPLLRWFRTGDGLDLRCLNEPRVVSALYDAVQILARQHREADGAPPPFELELYVYRELDDVTGETFIHAASELDFPTPAARETFLARLDDYQDWRCLKLSATFTEALDDRALEKMIAPLRAQSKHRAIKLSDLAHSLVACAELVDITPEWQALRAAHRG